MPTDYKILAESLDANGVRTVTVSTMPKAIAQANSMHGQREAEKIRAWRSVSRRHLHGHSLAAGSENEQARHIVKAVK